MSTTPRVPRRGQTTGRRTAVITGGASGLGLEAARAIARTPGWDLVLVVRDAVRGEASAAELRQGTPGATGTARAAGTAGGAVRRARVDVVAADLASLASVRDAARRIVAEHASVDALVLNAGTQVMSADRATQDGFELTFGVNHLAHFLLTTLLLDAGTLAGGARVVSLGSGTHHPSRRRTLGFPPARWRDPRALATPYAGSGRVAYATSKLAVILFAFELARREPSLRATAFDPGLVPATGLARAYPSAARRVYDRLTPLIVRVAGRVAATPGASGAQLAALATGTAHAGLTGAYVERGRVRISSPLSTDEATARELWAVSEALVAPWAAPLASAALPPPLAAARARRVTAAAAHPSEEA